MYLEEKDLVWAAGNIGKNCSISLEKVAQRSAEKIPYTTVDGVHDDKSGDKEIGWWTNGFWGGIMWQMYTLTGKEIYRNIAEQMKKKLDADCGL